MNLFCDLTYGIENNSLGNTLKDYILSLGVINNVIQYISVSITCSLEIKATFNDNSLYSIVSCTHSKSNIEQE